MLFVIGVSNDIGRITGEGFNVPIRAGPDRATRSR